MLLILCGKSGSGKDTVLKKFVKHGFIPLVSHTTRPKRENEVDGKDYHFVSYYDFMKSFDNFIEVRKYNRPQGESWFYGLKKQELNKYANYITISDIWGAKQLTKYFGKDNCFVVYLDVDDETRKKRVEKRDSFDENEWDTRLRCDSDDFTEEKMKDIINYSVKNNSTISDCVLMIILEILHRVQIGVD